jgi:hypothetical protein
MSTQTSTSKLTTFATLASVAIGAALIATPASATKKDEAIRLCEKNPKCTVNRDPGGGVTLGMGNVTISCPKQGDCTVLRPEQARQTSGQPSSSGMAGRQLRPDPRVTTYPGDLGNRGELPRSVRDNRRPSWAAPGGGIVPPVVRDHRTPNVIVRDHRTPWGSNPGAAPGGVVVRPDVRDHRTPNVIVRDHRGGGTMWASSGRR